MVRPIQTYKPRIFRGSGLPSRRITRLQSRELRASDSHGFLEQPTNLKTSPVEAISSGELFNIEAPVQKDSQENCLLLPDQDSWSQKQRLGGCGALLAKRKSKPLYPKRSYHSFLGKQLEQPLPPRSSLEKYSPDSEAEIRQDRSSDSPLSYCIPDHNSRRTLTWEPQSDRVAIVSPTFDSVETASQCSEMSLVNESTYRIKTLALNNVYLLSRDAQLPEQIVSLLDNIEKGCDFSGPSISDLWQDNELEALELNASEAQIQFYFGKNLFPTSAGTLWKSEKLPMSRCAVPHNDQFFAKISNPVPDMLFGYSQTRAFTEGQQIQLNLMDDHMIANQENLIYPFFVVEFKADGPTGGASLWAATNQCLGGSATCVNIAEYLNQHLKQFQSGDSLPIDSSVFSVAMSGTEARLYITWKHNDDIRYHTVKVKSFLLQLPESYLEFRKYVLNIIYWGTTKRLNQIREALDNLLEESRSRTSGDAKSRLPPSNFTRSGKKRKL